MAHNLAFSLFQTVSCWQGSILSPRLFAVFVDDLSKQLNNVKSVCFVGHHCITHVMYAYYVCLLAPSVLGLQKVLEMYYFFSQDNNVVFGHKKIEVNLLPVCLHKEKISRIHETKYLGYFLIEDQSDDVEISKQIRTLNIRSNKLLRTFSYCTIDVQK